MLSVIIFNFHHVVKFTIVVFNISSVSLSLEKSLVTPYTTSVSTRKMLCAFGSKRTLVLHYCVFWQFVKLTLGEQNLLRSL